MAAPMATTAHLQEPSSSQQGFGRQGYGSHQQLASPQAAHAQVVQAVQTGQAGHPAMLQVQLTQAPFVALPGAQLTQAPYWPVDMVAYPSSPTLLERIIHQVHYYFSAENLCRDEFLRGHMDPREGWVPIQLIASFNRLRSLTKDVNLVVEALRLSPELEVRNGMVRKRHDWQRWLLPQAQLGGPTIPTLLGRIIQRVEERVHLQTWFSESVPHEPYHCFLPASPPPLPVRIVFPDGTDDASRDKVLGAVVEVLATGCASCRDGE